MYHIIIKFDCLCSNVLKGPSRAYHWDFITRNVLLFTDIHRYNNNMFQSYTKPKTNKLKQLIFLKITIKKPDNIAYWHLLLSLLL